MIKTMLIVGLRLWGCHCHVMYILNVEVCMYVSVFNDILLIII